MRKLISRFSVMVLASVWFSAGAMVDLELTQGSAASIPVAILPLVGPSVSVTGQQTVMDVLTEDLQNSGEFRAVNQGVTVGSVSTIGAWRSHGADYVISGSIKRNGSDNYLVHVELQSLFADKSHAKKDMDELLDESYNVAQRGLRTLAHHISDKIYQKLTGTPGVFSTKIAYVLVQHSLNQLNSYQLEVADADGFNPQVLLKSNEPIMSPAWSPDGKALAYVSFEGHHAAIYWQNLQTGQRRVLSAAPGINGAPAFSPDGTKMALVLTKTGNPKIYLLDLQKNTLKELTFGWSIDTEPAFSADGSTLLFTSNRDGSPQIYQYSFPTGSVSRVTFDGKYNARASFSPDGQSIVLMHRDGGNYGIARLDLASGTMTPLVEAGSDESPSLAPNGKMLIYATQYGRRGVLGQVSIDGRIKLRLPAREGTVQEPAWSPFIK